MKTIKEAADALLSREEITQEQYDLIEKTGGFNISKEAGLGGIQKFLIGDLRTALLGGALTGATALAGKELIVDPLMRRSKIKKSFKDMTSKVPQLAEKDPEDMKDYFGVVKTFSPKAASNPLVAGALVNKMMEFGGVDHKLVQDISAIEQGLQRPSVIQSVTEAAAKSVAGFPKAD